MMTLVIMIMMMMIIINNLSLIVIFSKLIKINIIFYYYNINMFLQFVKKNITLASIIVFFVIFIIIIQTRPLLLFNKNGIPRHFGIGYKNKTICPIWLFVIISGIFSYLSILYLINYKQFIF